MVSYAHILPIIVCFFILTSLRRFWLCIGRFGALKEVSRRAPELIQSDLLAAATAVMPFLLALADWLQVVCIQVSQNQQPVSNSHPRRFANDHYS